MTPEKINSAEIQNIPAQKESIKFAPESVDKKTQRAIAEKQNTVDEQGLDEILASGYVDTPTAAPTKPVRQQDTINAEKLITQTDKQIAKKFGPNAFARFNPEQFA